MTFHYVHHAEQLGCRVVFAMKQSSVAHPDTPYPLALQVGRYFKVQERKTTLLQEMTAGTVTFLTIAYILSVNANILSDSGGDFCH